LARLSERVSWSGVATLVLLFALALINWVSAKETSRKYWPHTIAEFTAEDPHAWHKMHTHVEVKGFVTYTVKEADGDTHIRLCDSANIKTMDRKRCVVAECIPLLPCTKPPLGAHVQVDGISRFDAEGACAAGAEHCWWEVHPVENLTVLK
jgi:hypothetical protein